MPSESFAVGAAKLTIAESKPSKSVALESKRNRKPR